MEPKKHISGGSLSGRLPPGFTNYPWLVVHKLKKEKEEELQSFYKVNDHLSRFQCRMPELTGRRIRGCFHGWLILSHHPHNDIKWSLWNPVTSKIIRLPPLILKDGDFDDLGNCCLNSPPEDPTSILILLRKKKPYFVFCKLDLQRKKSKWVEMSYAKQLMRLTLDNDDILFSITCSNCRVYAMSLVTFNVIPIDMCVKDKEVVITLLPFLELPLPLPLLYTGSVFYWLKGSTEELFCIILGLDVVASWTPTVVYLFKLDTTSTAPTWEEVKDLNDAVFLVDFSVDPYSVYYHPAIASGLGGYIHIRGELGNRINSYHVKDKTVSLSPMPCLKQHHVSLWECRLEGNQEEAKCAVDFKQKEDNHDEAEIRLVTDDEVKLNGTTNESHLLSIPFHVLEMIMEFCVGVEYMKLRATCKRCHLAAPLSRVQRYSLDTPLLMVLEENQGILNFTDPIFGDKYFIKSLLVETHDKKLIKCSRYGWLLFYTNLIHLVFCNPFTRDVRNLPATPHVLENVCFSAPPTSPNCKVVGFTTQGGGNAYILYYVNQDLLWRRLDMDYGGAAPFAFRYPTFYGRDLYALCDEGKLVVFKDMSEENFSWEYVADEAPKFWGRTRLYFLVKCDEQLFLVAMTEYGSYVEVFELNDSKKEWKKIECLGRHSIYICDATCLAIESKTPKMQNKIYFPRLHSKDGKIVFYSLETNMYHTVNGEVMEEILWKNHLFGTKHLLRPHAWIEPSWW